MNPLRSRRDYGEEEDMKEDRIAESIVASMRKATKELYESAAEMPRGLQSLAGKYVGDGAIEVLMKPYITVVSDDEGVTVVAYKGRLLGVFEYGGAGLKKIKGLKDSVLLDYLTDQMADM